MATNPELGMVAIDQLAQFTGIRAAGKSLRNRGFESRQPSYEKIDTRSGFYNKLVKSLVIAFVALELRAARAENAAAIKMARDVFLIASFRKT